MNRKFCALGDILRKFLDLLDATAILHHYPNSEEIMNQNVRAYKKTEKL